jgi:hypothetical protein
MTPARPSIRGSSALSAAFLTPTPNGLRLHDLNSTNGTFIQIRRPKLLHDGDWFRLGDMILHLARYPRSG